VPTNVAGHEPNIDRRPIPMTPRQGLSPLPGHSARLLVNEGVRRSAPALGLVRCRSPIAVPMLGTLIAALVPVDVTEIPRLPREDGVTTPSAHHFLAGVDPLSPDPTLCLVRRAVTACCRLRLRHLLIFFTDGGGCASTAGESGAWRSTGPAPMAGGESTGSRRRSISDEGTRRRPPGAAPIRRARISPL
jgi:hypothetical protein